MSIVLPISCCRYNPRERAVNGGPPSPNTNALSLRPTPDRRCDRQETDHARTTNCHPLVQQRVKRVHPPSFHYTRTYIHMHTHTHAHTVTQTHAGYECTLSSFLVSLPVKIPSQFLCSGTPHQSLVRLSPFHPLSTASTTRRHPSTALFTHHPTLLQCSLSIWGQIASPSTTPHVGLRTREGKGVGHDHCQHRSLQLRSRDRRLRNTIPPHLRVDRTDIPLNCPSHSTIYGCMGGG